MKVLLDHCVPKRFGNLFPEYEVSHTSNLGWGHLSNGRLLTSAEDAGFQAIITVDQNMRHQQKIAGRRISIICLKSVMNTVPLLAPLAEAVRIELSRLEPGQIVIVRREDFPDDNPPL